MGNLTRSMDRSSGQRRARFTETVEDLAGAALKRIAFVATRSGRLRNVAIHQVSAGVDGTSWACQVSKEATNGGGSTNMLGTAGAITLAGGANKGGDAEGNITTGQSGVTRPVLSATAANLRFAKGDCLVFTFTPTGTYTTPPVIGAMVEVEWDK